MQPRPSEAFSKSSTQDSQQTDFPTTQDGFHHEHAQSSDRLHDQSGSRVSLSSADDREHDSELTDVSEDTSKSPVQRLSPVNTPPVESQLPLDTPESSGQLQDRGDSVLELALDELSTQVVTPSHRLIDLPNEILVDVLTHLPPETLSAITLVSHRFHNLVTTPHAWRVAFCRVFPGVEVLPSKRLKDSEDAVILSKREFTRLTALASWRSEYILRPKFLDALERGRPSHVLMPSAIPRNSRITSLQNGAQIAYYSNLPAPIEHLHCDFSAGLNKRSPRVVHGTADFAKVTSSDPFSGKIDTWGSTDTTVFSHFDELHPGELPYGLGDWPFVGLPNSMDLSQSNGMVLGEGFPGGMVFYRPMSEYVGKKLMTSLEDSAPELGIPRILPSTETPCCVWIAKTPNIPSVSGGLIGIISGSSLGMVTAYSFGKSRDTTAGGRKKGEITAKWVLSPGVPIIALKVDENYTATRMAKHRVWAVALNALGELFYLTSMPEVPENDSATSNLEPAELYRRAWMTGRSVFWSFVESSRRSPKSDLTARENAHATYSPRSSWDGMALGQDQISAETSEIQAYLRKSPKQIRELCSGWDMQRRLEVDFAGDDEHDAGETIVILDCGTNQDSPTSVRRFMRLKVQNTSQSPIPSTDSSRDTSPPGSPKVMPTSIFGGDRPSLATATSWSFATPARDHTDQPASNPATPKAEVIEIWRESKLSLGGLKDPTISCTAVDDSIYAIKSIFEDPLMTLTASSTSSPQDTPPSNIPQHTKASEVVGQRARFLAIGTTLGSILVWNIRASPNTTKPLRPVRVITTPDLREVSCLALNALCLVHGDNEGVVQAWDPLASSLQPIKTLHSRFSSRQRRQILEAHHIPHGINVFGAGTICLDPDPTVLRGVVSLGRNVHFWSFSSADASRYKPGKRRLRRSPRGSNHNDSRMGRLGRNAINDYISKEQAELEKDEKARRKEMKRFAGRYGTDLLGPDATDEEMVAYARLLSQESAINDQARALSEGTSSDTTTEAFTSPSIHPSEVEIPDDPDLAQTVLLSLQDSGSPVVDRASASPPSFDIPLRFAKKKGNKSSSSSPPVIGPGNHSQPEMDDLEFALLLSRTEAESVQQHETNNSNASSDLPVAGSSNQPEKDDLEFALQLSRAEAASNASEEEFPALERRSSDESQGTAKGKGKGKCKGR